MVEKNKYLSICRQIANPDLKEDNNKIVWQVQIDLNPSYNRIKYDHLYTKKFYHCYNDGFGSNFGGHDFGGGHHCGGGATGSW